MKKLHKYSLCTIGSSVGSCGNKRTFPPQSREQNTVLSNIYIYIYIFFTILYRFSILTVPTNHITYKDGISLHARTPSLAHESVSPGTEIVFSKNVMICFTLCLLSSWTSSLVLLETGYWPNEPLAVLTLLCFIQSFTRSEPDIAFYVAFCTN